jgi:uncharacterized membrane protein YbhN (UPF0104 family)
MKMAIRRNLGTLLKLSFTAAALLFVFTQVDFADIGQRLLHADWRWSLLGFMLVNLSLVVRAYRWLALLRGLGTDVRVGRLIELWFVANFFNSFLPSGLSGDVVRAIEVADDVPADVAAGTVIIDRATGLLALFVLSLLALPFRPVNFPTYLLWIIGGICAGGLAAGFVLLDGRLPRRFGRFIPNKLQPLWDKLDRVLQAVEACGWPAIWQAMAVSAVFNLIQIAWFWAAGRALGYTNVGLVPYFLIVPIMAIAILLPSIGGLGIRESVAPILFNSAGLSDDQAVALTLLVFAFERFSGLLGAPVYIFSLLRRRPSAPAEP